MTDRVYFDGPPAASSNAGFLSKNPVSLPLAEDGDGEEVDGGDNWLRLLDERGEIFDFAKVIAPVDLHEYDPAAQHSEPGAAGASELARLCFTNDGRRLFVNVQYPGVSCVIEGPWHRLSAAPRR